uniref:methionine--tRNA ligase n=1 Tax=Helianthus annuus TaxID=4232 RepID=A0A251VL00_HELAN
MAAGDVHRSVKLPIPGKRNILITSALPYVNNVPHLGNIIGCVLSADVFARYCRLRGYNAIYMCGTDEYGTATETKALEENCTPKEICDKYHAIHRDVYKWFNISFDEFGRTSTPQQTQVCQSIFKKLMENNCLSEDTMQQSDQCEKCGKLLNPTELVNPRCKVCANSPHIRATNHLFLDLPSLEGKLRDYISSMSVVGSWSQNAIQATNAWLNEGLKQRCITRDLKWGVPVPHERFKDKFSMYGLMHRLDMSQSLRVTHMSGSSGGRILKMWICISLWARIMCPFTHIVMFPSTLLGTDENWTLMKNISVTEYLNYETGKFSKSKGVGVFGNDAKDTNIPVEVWRYYLLINRPEVSDTLFTWADLQAKLNSELLNNLGNFINRVLSFIAKDPGSGYNSIIPDVAGAETHLLSKTFGDRIGTCVEQYVEAMEKVKLKQGLKIAMTISGEGNAYLQESQFWKLYKEDKSSCSIVMKTSVGVVYLLACLLEPFMPSFSVEVLKQLSLPLQLSLSDEKGDVEKAKRPWEMVPAGHRIGTPAPLFKELKDEEVEFFRTKFAGSQADRAVKAEAEANKIAQQLKNSKVSG